MQNVENFLQPEGKEEKEEREVKKEKEKVEKKVEEKEKEKAVKVQKHAEHETNSEDRRVAEVECERDSRPKRSHEEKDTDTDNPIGLLYFVIIWSFLCIGLLLVLKSSNLRRER